MKKTKIRFSPSQKKRASRIPCLGLALDLATLPSSFGSARISYFFLLKASNKISPLLIEIVESGLNLELL